MNLKPTYCFKPTNHEQTTNEYLNQISVQENPFTDWEIFKDEKNCYAEEIKDVNKSIDFIKKLYV